MLQKILLKAGQITGPLKDGNTSHSCMSSSKTFLLGLKFFDGNETFLVFGRVLHDHLQFIENTKYRAKEFKTLTKQEQKWILGCCKVVRENPLVKRLIKNSIREQKVYEYIDGTKVSMLLDVEQRLEKTGSDWKSTACGNMHQFISKAINDYDYIRQGKTYKKARKLKNFYFIGIKKRPPHAVFIMDTSQYKKDEFYAEQELDFLLYFFRNYGKVIKPKKENVASPKDAALTINNQKPMATAKGKQALAKIKVLKKEHEKLSKDAYKAKTAATKAGSKLQKAINQFPKKEVSLYEEQLGKLKPVKGADEESE